MAKTNREAKAKTPPQDEAQGLREKTRDAPDRTEPFAALGAGDRGAGDRGLQCSDTFEGLGRWQNKQNKTGGFWPPDPRLT
ncbi:MAG: hypothetical protein ACOCYN_04980, partial [Planctomycetota bacterium]